MSFNTCNFICSSDTESNSGNNFTYKEFIKNFHSLHDLKSKQYLLKENLLILNEENENITKSLTKIKKELITVQSELQRTLFLVNVKVDKQKILLKKKLDDFYHKKIVLEHEFQKSPILSELQDIIKSNNKLLEEYNKLNTLFVSTRNQYNEMILSFESTFKMKVCEFCELYFSLKTHKDITLS